MEHIKLTALSQTVITRNHALITGDGFVNSVIPGWKNCEINVVINEAMGAHFCQLFATLNSDSQIISKTVKSQLFLYVLEGEVSLKINQEINALSQGSYAYIPISSEYELKGAKPKTKMLCFIKEYEFAHGIEIPNVIINKEANIEKAIYCDDPNLIMQNLLPDQNDLRFDMAINIFTYNPGANLPFVETHIMEHGLMYLQGQGIYRLDDKWYPVKKGDCIWMAPYCPQWFGALGTEPAVYIYYKNVNRFPTTI